MSSGDISLLTKKKSVLNSINIKGGNLSLSKDLTTSLITCNKLICDEIEINNSDETFIDNASITNSRINRTNIGSIEPGKGIFNKFEIKAAGNLSEAFKIDSDIFIENRKNLNQKRNIISKNPFSIYTPQYLELTSDKYLSIKSNFNIDIFSKNHLNINIDKTININSNIFYINSSTIFNKNLHIYSPIISYNNTNSYNLNSGSHINYGGSVIKKNCFIGGNLNLLDTYNSNTFNIFSNTYFNKTVSFNNNIIINSNNSSFITYGNINIHKNIFIKGNITSNNSCILNKNLYVKNNIYLDKSINVKDSLIVENDITSKNIISKSLIIYGNNIINHNSIIKGNNTIHSDNIIYGNNIINYNSIIKANNNIYGNILINKNSIIKGNNTIQSDNIIYGNNIINYNSIIKGNNTIHSDNIIYGNNIIYNDILINKNSIIKGNNTIYGNNIINHNSIIKANNTIYGNILINKNSIIKGNNTIQGDIFINKNSIIKGSNIIDGDILIKGNNITNGNSHFKGNIHIDGQLSLAGDIGYIGYVNKTHTIINDNIIELNTGVINNVFDSGMLIHRGFAGNNAFMGWKEQTKEFILGTIENNYDNNIVSSDYFVNVNKGILNSNISSDFILTQNLNVNSITNLYNKFYNYAQTTLYNTLTSYNPIFMNHKLYINNNYNIGVIINSNTLFNYNTTFNGLFHSNNKSYFNNITTFSNNININNNNTFLNIHATSNFYSNLNIKNNINFFNPLFISKETTFNDNIYTKKNITIFGNTIINKKLDIFGKLYLYNDFIIGNNNTNTIKFNSKLHNFNMYNGLQFKNNNNNLYLSNINTTYINSNINIFKSSIINKNLIVFNNSIFGHNFNTSIIFNSKISDFKMHNNALFINTNNNLTIKNNNIYLDANLNTNTLNILNNIYLKSNNSSINFQNNSFILNNFNSLLIKHNNTYIDSNLKTNSLTINNNLNVINNTILSSLKVSKLHDFYMNNGALFQNNLNSLLIKYNNTYINSNLNTNSLTINNNLNVSNTTFLSKLYDFHMHNGASFKNNSNILTIKHNNTFIDSNLTTNKLIINNNATFNSNLIIGKSFDNTIIFNSKLSNFTTTNNSQFINTPSLLTIKQLNMFLDTNLSTNSLTINNNLNVKKQTFLQDNIICGSSSNNIITFNSKLSNFTTTNNSQFINTPSLLTIKQLNTFLDTNLSTNTLTINNNLNVNNNSKFIGNITFGNSSNNIITFNSKLSDFTMINGTQFITSYEHLSIKEKLTTFDGNIASNYATVKNNLLVFQESNFYGNIIIGSSSNNTILFNSKVSDFSMYNNTSFKNINNNTLQISQQNITLNSNTTTNQLIVNNDSFLNKNVIIGTDTNNTLIFNSKISDFTMFHGAQIQNLSNNTLLFTNNNITFNGNTFINSNLNIQKNTFISDSLIVNNKITTNHLIVHKDINVSGNLSVNGKVSIIDAENMTILDNIIELNHGVIDNFNDSGIIINRGSNKLNTFIGWKEYDNSFILGTTNQTNNTMGQIYINNISTLKANILGNINAYDLNVSNNSIFNKSAIFNHTSSFYNNVQFGHSNSNNIITFFSKLSDFSLHNGASISNTFQHLNFFEKYSKFYGDILSNNISINNNLYVKQNSHFYSNITIGSSSNDLITFNSKLSNFTMINNTNFNNTSGLLTITQNNIYLNSNLTSNSLTLNNNLNILQNFILKGNSYIGNTLNNFLKINSKISDFIMHNNAQFINNTNNLHIISNNIHLDSQVFIKNNLNVNKNLFILHNTIIGNTQNNLLKINSKISDFKMHNNAQFINNTNNLHIISNNIHLDSQVFIKNNLNINKNLFISKNTIIGSNQNNFLKINSKISDFIMHNNALFTNTSDLLTIKQNNIYLNSNFNTNQAHINNNLNLYNNLIFHNTNSIIYSANLHNFTTTNNTSFINKPDLFIINQKNIYQNANVSANSIIIYNQTNLLNNINLGSSSNNFINIKAKFSDFKMNNNTLFSNKDYNTLLIQQNNIILNTNLNILHNTYIQKSLFVNKSAHFLNNIHIGNNNNNHYIYLNSKLSDFYTINNTLFNNYNSNTFLIQQDNIILNSNLSVLNNTILHKDIFIKGNSYFNNNIILGNNNNNNITFNAKLHNFTMNHGAQFKNNNNLLHIIENNILLDAFINISKNLNINNNLNINDSLIVNNNLDVYKSLHTFYNAFFYSNINCSNSIQSKDIAILNNLTVSNITTTGTVQSKGTLETPNISVDNNINTTNLFVSNILKAFIGNPINNFDNLSGNIGLNSNLLIPDAFQKLDYWINYYLIDTPPIHTNPLSNTNPYYIDLYWNNPIQIYVAFLQKKVPFTSNINVDYKLSYKNEWNNSISFNSTSITHLRIHPIQSTNYISNNTFHLFNILHNTSYDFRIYSINHNKNRPYKYLYFNNLKTTSINTPSVINNVNIQYNNPLSSFNITWNNPTSNLDDIHNNLNIQKYLLTIIPVKTIKYNSNFIYSNINITINSNSIFNNANNFYTINNLYPGHTYAAQLKSKNFINNNYSNISHPIVKTTIFPISPNFINNNNIYILNNSNYTFSDNIAYDLNNKLINNLYDYDLLNNNFKTNIISDIRINHNISSTNFNESIIVMNLNNSLYNLNISAFSHINNSTEFFDNFNFNLYNQKDYYTNSLYTGFYKTLDFNVNFNSNNIFYPSNKEYNISFLQKFYNNNNIYNTNDLSFYVDKVNKPFISNLSVSQIYDYNYEFISGIPVFTSFKFNIDCISHNLTNNFYRNDKKFFDIIVSDDNNYIYNNLNINYDYIQNSSYFYNLNNELHNDGKSILPNTEKLLFKNINYQFNNSYNISTGYTENLNIKTNIFNLKYTNYNNFYFNNNIRTDFNSITTKNNLLNSNSSYGELVKSGLPQSFIHLPTNDKYKIHFDNKSYFENALLENPNTKMVYNNFISYNSNNIIFNNSNALFVHDFYNNYNNTLSTITNLNNIYYNYNIPFNYVDILRDINYVNNNNINHYKNIIPNIDYYNINSTDTNNVHHIYYVKIVNNRYELYTDENYINLVPYNSLVFIEKLTYRFYQTHHSNKDNLLLFSTSNLIHNYYSTTNTHSQPTFFNAYTEITIDVDLKNLYIYSSSELFFSLGFNYNNTIIIRKQEYYNYNVNISINPNFYVKNIHVNNNLFNINYNTNFLSNIKTVYSDNYNIISNIIEKQTTLTDNIYEFLTPYNHNENLNNNYSLQLLDGKFITNNYSNSYKKYDNYLLNNIYPDYSTIDDNIRYSTFKYANIDLSFNKITLEIIDSNITEINDPDVNIYIKIFNNITNFESNWFNCSKFINMIGLSKYSPNDSPCLSKFNPVSYFYKRYIYLPRNSSGNIIVRVAINMNSNKYFRYIKLSSNFI